MPELHALLASSIVCTLEDREHVLVAPGCADALCAALEPVVARCIPALERPLRAGRTQGLLPVPPGERRSAVHRALATTARQVSKMLLETDHLDDVFADEATIRQEVLRAMRELLLSVLRGELEVEDAPDSGEVEKRSAVRLSEPALTPAGSWRPNTPTSPNHRSSWRPSDSSRGEAAAGVEPLLDGDGAAADGQLGFFLENLERALWVLEEQGEGPASAPVPFTIAPPAPTPSPARAPRAARRGSTARRRAARGAQTSPAPQRTKSSPRHRKAPPPTPTAGRRGPGAPAVRSATAPSSQARRVAGEAEPPTQRRRRKEPSNSSTERSDAKATARKGANGRPRRGSPSAATRPPGVRARQPAVKRERPSREMPQGVPRSGGARRSAARRQAESPVASDPAAPMSQGRRKSKTLTARAVTTAGGNRRRAGHAAADRPGAPTNEPPRRRAAAGGSRTKR